MKKISLVAICGLSMAVPNIAAAVSDAELAELREQLALMSQRLDQLEAENAALQQSQSEVVSSIAVVETSVADVKAMDIVVPEEAWSDRVKLDGDFRFRYESIGVEGSQTRQRTRIRARTNIKAKVADKTQVGFGLATGGSDPVSTNQTLGGGGSSKSVVLNLAYVDWEATDGLNLIAGKFKNPLTRPGGTSLMWDGDWTPEGVAFKYKGDRFFANGFGSYLESDSNKANDSFAWGGQIGMTGSLGGMNLTGGVSYYSIEAAGKATTFGDPSDPGDFFGNTAIQPGGLPCGTIPDVECVYAYDYLLTEVFAEAKFRVADTPVTLFGDFVTNGDVSENDTGWTLGAKIGQAKDRGQWQFTYFYAEKEADSMLGLVTDSDFGGGGTDNKGHWVQVNWGVNKNWVIGAQYFVNDVDLASGSSSDYDRLMIDMQWKWK
jgi:hypothetical protein